jgi:coenzyme F420-reducing hydrogenase gamma subunit
VPGQNIDALSSDGKLKLAAFKFTSCDGCQLQILNLEDDLLQLARAAEIDFFLEARRREGTPPYDLGFVEGSISTPREEEEIRQVRRHCKVLVTIGACATSGGIQALRNWGEVDEFNRYVYPEPEHIESLVTSTPIASHVFVDYELRGCPINPQHLLELVSAALAGRRPNIATHSLCIECKRSGNPCVLVSQGKPCLGPITQVGCGGALCPNHNRACYGCFGPMEQPNVRSLGRWFTRDLQYSPREMKNMLRLFNGYLEPFKQASDHYEEQQQQQAGVGTTQS